MSASTVSITANPNSTRRRPVLAGETKKGSTSIGLMGDDGFVSQINGDVGTYGGDDKTCGGGGGGGRDLSRSIGGGGDSVLERSRDLLQVKKTTVTATVSPRRAKKVVGKAEKPKWARVMSVFTKNFVLLVVLLGCAQLIRKMVMNKGGDDLSGFTSSDVMDFEKRITQTESLLKTTTRMMQAQVEVVDRKIESEIGGLKRELGKKIDENGAMLEEELKRIGGRTEGLEKSLTELKAMDLMSKEDFDKFYNELKKDSEVDDGDSGGTMLDNIRASLKDMLAKEFEKHGADGLGRPDYALATGGARVVEHSEPLLFGHNWKQSRGRHLSNDAEKMLRPSFGEPGQCFPLKGSSGFVQIKLRTAIVPEAITLEHVHKSVAFDSSSAPKDCQVTGWLEKKHGSIVKAEEKKFGLVEFTYDLEKSNIQTYDVPQAADSEIVVDTIRLDFTSNHGSPHTCIYRLRVHGHEPSPVPVLGIQA